MAKEYSDYLDALIYHLINNRDLISKVDFNFIDNNEASILVKAMRIDKNVAVDELCLESSALQPQVFLISKANGISFKEALEQLKIHNENLRTCMRAEATVQRLQNDMFSKIEQPATLISLKEVVRKLQNNEYPVVSGVEFGWPSIDNLINVLPAGATTVIGGNTGTGKTMLCLNRSMYWASQGQKVLFVSLEITGQRLGECCVAMKLNKSRHEIDFSSIPVENFTDNLQFLEITTITNVSDILNKIEHIDYDILIIDYIQMLAMEEDRRLSIDKAVFALRAEATRRNAVLILVSQLTRTSNGVPGLESFKESGTIAQDANTAITLYSTKGAVMREDPAKIAGDPFKVAADTQESLARKEYGDWVVLMNVVKTREGSTGGANLILDRSTGNYYDPDGRMLRDVIQKIRFNKNKENA